MQELLPLQLPPVNTPRPTRRDPAILQKAAEAMVKPIKEWLQNDPMEDEEIIKDLVEAMRWDTDAYKIAKELDHKGWDPDEQLVDVLGMVSIKVMTAHKEACIEWVKAKQLTPPEHLSKVLHPENPERGEGIVGTIHDEGTATISFPALGHLHPTSKESGSRGYVIPWEDLVPAIPTPATDEA